MNRRIARTAQAGALLLALVLVPAALAAKGHGGGGNTGTSGSSSISQPVMVTDTGTPGLSWGDTVTFDVSTTATTTPFVNLACYQNGVQVATGTKGFWDGSIDVNWNFGLSSPMWQSGAADCVASVEKQTKQGWQQLASVSFHVDA
jgi:hypothetical protein